jgi:hypothetical protein
MEGAPQLADDEDPRARTDATLIVEGDEDHEAYREGRSEG